MMQTTNPSATTPASAPPANGFVPNMTVAPGQGVPGDCYVGINHEALVHPYAMLRATRPYYIPHSARSMTAHPVFHPATLIPLLLFHRQLLECLLVLLKGTTASRIPGKNLTDVMFARKGSPELNTLNPYADSPQWREAIWLFGLFENVQTS